MRHIRSVVILLTLTLAFAGSALADSANMTFLGPAGNNSGGVYTYPYEFSINGSSTPVALICDAFDNDVVAGETWTATVTSLLSGSQAGGGGMFAGQTQQYKAAGLIFLGILDGSINANLGNWAIWGLFSADARSNPTYLSSGALGLDIAKLIEASNPLLNNSIFANLVLYTPVAGTQSWGGTPQEYIGIKVPEPAEIALMLLMVIGGAMGFVYRQRLGLKLAVAQA